VSQRDRLVAAMGELVATAGVSAVGVHHVCQRAGISRRTFYELYRDRDACFADALQEAYGRLVTHVDQAVAGAGDVWEDRAVATAQALVAVLHADRVLAQLCVVSATGGSREAVRLRHAAMAQILKGLAGPPASASAGEPVLAGALGGVWELVYRRLTAEPETPVSELVDAAVYVLLAPFVGPQQAAARARDLEAAAVVGVPRALGAPAELGDGTMMTELAGQTLQYLSARPGSANVEIARAVDVRHESQMSRHLVRLERAGLVKRRKEGRTNAWRLTARGEEAAQALYGAPAHKNAAGGSASRGDA
jgi:AcrR family transcriptional regulator